VKRLVPVPILIAVLLSACGTFGRGDVAATVNGKDITVTQVNELVVALTKAGDANAQSSGTATTTTIAATQNGDTARNSLQFLIRGAAAEALVSELGAKVTAADTQSAEQQVQGAKLSSATKDSLVRGFAAEAAIVRRAAADTNSRFIRKLRRDLLAQVPADQRDLVCADGLVGPTTAADQVRKLLGQGTKLTDVQAFSAAGYQGLSQSATEFCISPSTLPTELQTPFSTAAVGVLTSAAYTTQDQQGQSVSGTVFFVVTSRRTLTESDPQIASAVEQQLTKDPSVLFDANKAKLHVTVDSRYGSGWTAAGGVQAPPAPLVKPQQASPLALPTGATQTTP